MTTEVDGLIPPLGQFQGVDPTQGNGPSPTIIFSAAINALVKSIDHLDETVKEMSEQNRLAAQAHAREHQQVTEALTRVLEGQNAQHGGVQ